MMKYSITMRCYTLLLEFPCAQVALVHKTHLKPNAEEEGLCMHLKFNFMPEHWRTYNFYIKIVKSQPKGKCFSFKCLNCLISKAICWEVPENWPQVGSWVLPWGAQRNASLMTEKGKITVQGKEQERAGSHDDSI